MKRAYKKRPLDFKRRTLSRITDKRLLFKEEGIWLRFIKKEELGKRYYNLHNMERTHWSITNPEVSIRISDTLKGKKFSEERLARWKELCNTEENKKRTSERSKNFSKELRQQIADTRRGVPIHTEESKRKIGEIHRQRVQSTEEKEKRANSLKGRKRTTSAKENISAGKKGKYFTLEHKEKLSIAAKTRVRQSNTGRKFTIEHRNKLSAVCNNAVGTKWMNNGIISMRIYRDDIENKLNDGFVMGRLTRQQEKK